jgi:hypothetical protein
MYSRTAARRFHNPCANITLKRRPTREIGFLKPFVQTRKLFFDVGMMGKPNDFRANRK